jgi:flagellar protein FliT
MNKAISMDIIAHYAAIAASSGRMLAAARANNWQELVSAQDECAQRVRVLEALGHVAPRDDYERETRIGLLKTILAHDAEIRDLAAPWLQQLNGMLGNLHQGRRMRQAYS